MSARYHIWITTHPEDALRVLLHEQVAGPRLVIFCEGDARLLYSMGYQLPYDYPGAAALEGAPVEEVSVRLVDRGSEHRLVLPPGENFARSSLRPFLDRFRESSGRNGTVDLIMTYAGAAAHLPPLEEEDAVTCLWEIRDLPPPEWPAQAAFLAGETTTSGALMTGLRLYARKPLPPDEVRRREEEIRRVCAVVDDAPVLILSENIKLPEVKP